jgi:hypothetical protein
MASHLPRALPTGQGPSPSDHIASTTSTAAAKNASTAMVVSMTSPVNSPNLPNTVSNAHIANLRNISNIATWPISGKGPYRHPSSTAPERDEVDDFRSRDWTNCL